MKTKLKIKKIIALLENQNIQYKAILSFQEALAYLDVSKSFLYKLTSSNSITFFKPSGKLIYFKKSDLDQWVLQNKFQQSSSLEQELNNYLNSKSNGNAE